MLRASLVEILLTRADLQEILEGYAAGKAENLQITLSDGAVVVRLKAVSERLPMAVPLEMRLTVRQVSVARIVLGVEWTNMGLVPGFVKEMALSRAFEALPGDYADGVLTVDMAELLDELPVQFSIRDVEVSPEAIRVTLGDVMAFPVQPVVEVDGASVALVPVPSQAEADLPEHRGFYQKLRAQVGTYTREKAPRWIQPLVPWLLAVPDFFVLVVNLARHERVPPVAKVIAGVAVAYFITPIDFIPDVIPLVGEVDDLTLALFAVDQIAQRVPADVLQECWPGEGRVLDLVAEGQKLFSRALPNKLILNLKKLLKRS